MKKIVVEKTEGIAEVIDRILNEPDKTITLVIPKGSALGRSASNFHLLKREADSAGRDVVIESVDEGILAFAKESRIEATHPLWRGVRGSGGFSDIVPRGDREKEGPSFADDDDDDETVKPAVSKKHTKKEKPAEEVEMEEAVEEEREKDEESSDRFFNVGGRRAINRDVDNNDDESSQGGSKKVYFWIGAVVVVALGAFYVVSAFFGHANVMIDFQQTPWTYQNNFVASKSVSAIDPTNNVIPAQVFTSTKDITETFPATGTGQSVQDKAQGMITIYNNYGTSSQELVATTRFLTPDGKIFRIVNDVTVPGATMTNGTLTPSSITTPIVADQAGPDYNIGPVAHLTIPGFANDTARENGFYGTITASTTGGFIGNRVVPTAADITKAKASTTAILQASLQSGFSGSYPNNFNILTGATSVQITELTVNTSTDANGNFSVFGEATLQAIGFDESAFKAYLLSIAQAQDASSTFSSINLTYSAVVANFIKGQVSFSLSAQGTLEPAFSVDDFKSGIVGKSISDARAQIAALPQLSNGEISVWPSWLWSIPSNPNKVNIAVQ